MPALTPNERLLTARIGELTETIRQQRAALSPPRARHWKRHFSRSETSIIEHLILGGIWSHEELRRGIDFVISRFERGSEEGIFVAISRIRKKLAPASLAYGLGPMKIRTYWGRGYSMDEASIATLATLALPERDRHPTPRTIQ